MSRLVVSDQAPLLVGQDPTAALQTEHHFVLRILQIPHVHDGLVAAGGEQRGLVHDVRKLGAGEAGRAARDALQVHAGRQRDFARVHAQDLLPPLHVRHVDHDLAVEAPRPQQRRVEDVGPVGGREQDDPVVRLEAVHLNQLLVEMDGFESNDGVILLAATNRPDILDPALLRPGRFDRQIVVDMPDVKGREQILRVHTRKIPLAAGVDLERIARGTAGLAGAELANIVNEAALLAARRNKAVVDMRDLEDAKDKVMLGLERRSRVLSDEERRLIAYHEAGHALVSLSVPGSDPLHKVTIIPRGRALGITAYLAEEELHKYTKQSILSRLAMAYGGRVAEELVFGPEKVTTGAAQDIQHATDVARRMVTQYGMSDTIGPIAIGDREAEIFLGREVVQRREISERTAELVDTEVKRILGDAYERAKTVLLERRDALDRLAAALLERETLDREEVELVVAGKPLPPLPPPPAAPAAPSAEGTTREKTPARGPVLGSPPPEPAGA